MMENCHVVTSDQNWKIQHLAAGGRPTLIEATLSIIQFSLENAILLVFEQLYAKYKENLHKNHCEFMSRWKVIKKERWFCV